MAPRWDFFLMCQIKLTVLFEMSESMDPVNSFNTFVKGRRRRCAYGITSHRCNRLCLPNLMKENHCRITEISMPRLYARNGDPTKLLYHCAVTPTNVITYGGLDVSYMMRYYYCMKSKKTIARPPMFECRCYYHSTDLANFATRKHFDYVHNQVTKFLRELPEHCKVMK